MKNIPRFFLFITLLFLTALLPQGLAAEGAWTDQIQRQFDEIKTRLENIEKQQQGIAEKDDKILGELDRLRVWVRRK